MLYINLEQLTTEIQVNIIISHTIYIYIYSMIAPDNTCKVQCPKLRICLMHTSGAGSSKTMHPAINVCTLHSSLYMYTLNFQKMKAPLISDTEGNSEYAVSRSTGTRAYGRSMTEVQLFRYNHHVLNSTTML